MLKACYAALGILILVGNLLFLSSDLTSRLASEYYPRSHQAALDVLAAERAVLPWESADLQARSAEIELRHISGEQSLESFRRALAQRPIDARLWSRYSLALLYAGRWEEAAMAAKTSLALAPNSRSIALEQAAIGAPFYREVSLPLRQQWHQAAQLSARYNWQVTRAYLIAANREQEFCSLIDKDSPAHTWCHAIDGFEESCRSQKALPWRQQRRCQELGYRG